MSQVSSTETPRDALATLRIRRTEIAPRPSLIWRFLRLIMVLTAIAAIVGGGILVGQKQGWIPASSQLLTMPEAMRARPEVRTATVSAEKGRSADALVVATGFLESRRQAMIGARAPGRIQELKVEEGTVVSTAEILAVLEHDDLDASLTAVKATAERARSELGEQDIEIEQAQRELKRAERLLAAKSMNEAEYETARYRYQSAAARKLSLEAAVHLADARVMEAERLRENMFIRAPFDGTVISKDAEVGESILPGGMGEASGRGSVVTIADLEHLEVDSDVKEDYINRVVVGQSAEVAVDAVPGERFQGRVRKIIPMGDRARATIKVKVEVLNADGRLFPNMSSTVYFLPERQPSDNSESERTRIFCPEKAVVKDEAGFYVFVVGSDSRVKKLVVTIADTKDGRTEISSGLSGGEQVIVSPSADLREGTLVKTSQ